MEAPGWLPPAVAEWLAPPPRPPLVSERDCRRLTICLFPAVRERLAQVEAKPGVRTAGDAVAAALRESL